MPRYMTNLLAIKLLSLRGAIAAKWCSNKLWFDNFQNWFYFLSFIHGLILLGLWTATQDQSWHDTTQITYFLCQLVERKATKVTLQQHHLQAYSCPSHFHFQPRHDNFLDALNFLRTKWPKFLKPRKTLSTRGQTQIFTMLNLLTNSKPIDCCFKFSQNPTFFQISLSLQIPKHMQAAIQSHAMTYGSCHSKQCYDTCRTTIQTKCFHHFSGHILTRKSKSVLEFWLKPNQNLNLT